MIDLIYCILDVETDVQGRDKANPEQDILRYVGFKYQDKKICFHVSEREKIQKAINFFQYFVGHNIKKYDKVVMERHGFKFNYKQVFIDTYEISENRLKSMMYIDLNVGDMKLGALCDRFNLKNKKGEFDYPLLSKERLEGEEYDLLVEYLFGDLDASDELFQYYYNFFYGFKKYMSEEDQRRMSWLRNRPGSTAYKVFCNLTGLPEEYDDSVDDSDDDPLYSGGYVSEPIYEFIEGNLHCFDFSSLYPHIYMNFCLFNKAKEGEDYFKGSDIYPSLFGNEADGIRGKYRREWGKVEKVINQLYTERMNVDKKLKDPNTPKDQLPRLKNEKLAIKILINTLYGISGSPKFKSVYDPVTAADCTALARRSIKHARSVLEDAGYTCVYTDTDSVYVLDPYKDIAKLIKTTEYISEWQRNSSNVRVETHKFMHETAIKRMYFFRDDDGNFIKKHYLFVNDKDELTIKGIGVKRGNCSKLAKKFFDEVISKQFIDNTYKPYKAVDLLEQLKQYTVGREELLLKRYRTHTPESYKVTDGKDEASGLYYQIAKKYGQGEHWLIMNKRIGAGKGNKYAPIDDLKAKYGDHWIDQVTFEMYLSDLKEFIEVKDRKSLAKTDRKRVKHEE